MPSKRIAILTGTRADWGLLSPVAKAMKERDDLTPLVVATNMHLLDRYGGTLSEIEADGLEVAACVPIGECDGSAASTLAAMGRCMEGVGEVLGRLKPDMAVILGDRFEMLAAATASMVSGIPIAHIAGGETTLGAIDDAFRHSITHMASLHLTQTEAYRQRIIGMGKAPETVINAGALGVFNALHHPVMTREELAASIGLPLTRPTLLVTFHAATADPGSPTEQFGELLSALDKIADADVILTYPNNDPRGGGLIAMIEDWVRRNSARARFFPSLGKHRYLSALRYVSAVVGNSSSGILEVPSVGIPTVNIGSRQQGRISAESVINCAPEREAIAAAILRALGMQVPVSFDANPYFRPDTVEVIVNAIADYVESREALREKF